MVSKLVAGREKDLVFAAALLDAGLIQASALMERAHMLDELPGVIRRIVRWIESWGAPLPAMTLAALDGAGAFR